MSLGSLVIAIIIQTTSFVWKTSFETLYSPVTQSHDANAFYTDLQNNGIFNKPGPHNTLVLAQFLGVELTPRITYKMHYIFRIRFTIDLLYHTVRWPLSDV